jgi:tetrahydromethanopterin S-methyltransferase subunit D
MIHYLKSTKNKKKNPPVNRWLQELYVNSGTLEGLLCFLSGYLIGTEQWLAGVLVTVLYFTVGNLNTRLWLIVFKKQLGG